MNKLYSASPSIEMSLGVAETEDGELISVWCDECSLLGDWQKIDKDKIENEIKKATNKILRDVIATKGEAK